MTPEEKSTFTALRRALPSNYPLATGTLRCISGFGGDVWGWFSPPEDKVPFFVIAYGEERASACGEALRRAACELFAAYIIDLSRSSADAWAVDGTQLEPLGSLAEIPFPNGRQQRAGATAPRQQPLFKVQTADTKALASLFERVHNELRNGDGLQPPEALDELLRFLFLYLYRERSGKHTLTRRWVAWCDGRTEMEPHAIYAQRLRGALLEASRDESDSFVLMDSIGGFGLSSPTLARVADLLADIRFSEMPVDLKSQALTGFLTNNVRRGLGVYPTPDPVVQAVVSILSPTSSMRILDPACGTGSFLLHTVYRWIATGHCTVDPTGSDKADCTLWGVDKNLRILRVAEVNLAPLVGRAFHAWNGDALVPLHGRSDERPTWFAPASFDVIMTNPPFGVTVNGGTIEASRFSSALTDDGSFVPRMGSEVLFIERCLDLLRPGGVLATVVPNSVVSNVSLERARQAIESKGQLLAVLALPPETFATTGTQSATSVLFFQRRGGKPMFSVPAGTVYSATSSNMGFDSTGRPRSGSDLPEIAMLTREFLLGRDLSPGHSGRVLSLAPGKEFSAYSGAQSIASRPSSAKGIKLRDCVSAIRIGKTPPRDMYCDEGHFILKVGNLTGGGIEWFARDRNFVTSAYMAKLARGRVARDLVVQQGDILLTSSAHTVRYIAKKVDMVDQIPDFIQQPVTFVGELLLLRPRPEVIDPYALLAFLRSAGAQASLQAMVRGQTAHLMPNDAGELMVPLMDRTDERLASLAELIRAEARVQYESTYRRQEMDRVIQELFGR